MVLLAFGIVAVLGYREMEKIGSLVDQIYEHPFTVATVIRDIRSAAGQSHGLIGTVHWDKDARPSDVVTAGLAAGQRAIAAGLERVSARYLGPRSDIEQTRSALEAWTAAQERLLALAPAGNAQERAVLVQDENDAFRMVIDAIGRIVSFSGAGAQELRDRSHDIIAETLWDWGVALGVIGVLLLGLAWQVTRSLTVPITRLCAVMGDLTAGRLDAAIPYRDSRSEIGTIANTLAGFQGTARRLAEEGAFDAQAATIATVIQAQNSLSRLVAVLLPLLTRALPPGSWTALYIRRGADWSLAGTDVPEGAGGTGGEDLPPVLAPADAAAAEAGVGRAADIPQVPVNGSWPLRLVLCVREQAVGVLVLSSPTPLPPQTVRFLERIRNLLALGIEGLRRREQAETLLARTSEQAWELEVRAEALRASEEKLRMANEELSQQAAVLAEQRQQTEMAWAEAERKAREADNANRHKSEFLANMSHEIRTPLNAILGLAYLLERTPLNGEQGDQVAKIGLAGRSLLSIVNDILDFSRIEAGRLELESTPFNLPSVIEAIAAMADVNAQAKALDFQVDVAPDVPSALSGDGFRLQQVLVNLTGNAIKFTETGVVRLAVETLSADGGAVRLRFTVSDTGIGIPAAALPTLFQAFSQADASTTRRFGGSGLGLAISKRLVEMMGGSIAVTSTPGQGSRFTVEIPFARSAPSAAAPSAAVPARPSAAPSALSAGPAPLAGLRVLLVEDNTINRLVASRILESKGAVVVCEADGNGAVDRLRRDPGGFDVVLMDIQMPVMDGYAATAAIKGDLGLTSLPVIALTAGALAAEREKAAACGMDGFISKPFDVEELVKTVAGFAPLAVAV